MKTVIFKAAGITEIHNVRRIEEDHRNWYVWAGDPQNGPDRLKPEIFRKADGRLEVRNS